MDINSQALVFDSYFTEEEEKSLFAAVKRVDDPMARRDYFWMLFLRHTAVRESEMLALTVADAELFIASARIRIVRLKKRSEKPVVYEFFANKKVIEALKGLLAQRKQIADTKRWEGIPKNQQPLVISRAQRCITARSLQLRIKKWLKEAALDLPATPHWFRHTWAKRRFKNASDDPQTLLKIQAHLGHSDLSTTSIYLRPDKESMACFLAETY